MKLRLNKNQVVNCTTQEEADKCCQLAKSMWLAWSTGKSYDDTGWDNWDSDKYFRFSDGYCVNLSLCQYNNHQILTAQDFLTMHSEPFMGYFESDGTIEIGKNIINILEKLGGKNKNWLNGSAQMCYFIAEDSRIECKYLYNLPQGYHKCNLFHYLHLIDHSGDITETIEESAELADLRKQLAESKERERVVNALNERKCLEIEDLCNELSKLKSELDEERQRNERMFNNQQKMSIENKELIALRTENAELGQTKALYIAECESHKSTIEKLNVTKVKADKWDAVPKFFCVKGVKGRGEEIRGIFKNKTGKQVDGYSYEDEGVVYCISEDDDVFCIRVQSDEYDLLLATQTITELPPIEKKEEVVEFWLKPMDAYMWRFKENNTNNEWRVFQFDGIKDENIIILPFTPETEKLIGTTDEPDKKYCFMGVEPYFKQE